MGVFGDIVGSVAGPLLGGLFGRKDSDDAAELQSEALDRQRKWQVEDRRNNRQYAQRQTERDRAYAREQLERDRWYNRGQFRRLREDAIKAGFNPLSALGMTGGQYGGQPSQIMGAHVAQSGEWQAVPLSLPPMSSRSFIGEAIGAGISTWFNREQIARDREAERIQTELMREELRMARENRAVSGNQSFGFSIPQAVARGVERFGGPSYTRPRARPVGGAGPLVAEPVLVRRNDGLTSVNQDYPVEPEQDAYGWLRGGIFGREAREIYERNRPNLFPGFDVTPLKWWGHVPKLRDIAPGLYQ